MLTRRDYTNPYVAHFLNEMLSKSDKETTQGVSKNQCKTKPAVNIKEDDAQFVIQLLVPGFDKDDIVIDVDNQVLTISSKEKEAGAEVQKEERFTRKEFELGTFHRSFTLPENQIDEEGIRATHKNGVLTVELPKREEVLPKPARSISIA
jgi:HSP20 family protein